MLKRPVRPVTAAALLFCFALLLYRLSCGTRTRTRSERPAGEDAYEALLQQHERQYLLYTANLTKQIWQLKKDLKQRSVIFPPDLEERSRSELEEFMQNQLRRAEVGSGEQLENEFAVLPFDSFTLRRVYQLETGLTGHPVETPLRRDRRNELNGALEAALHLLNQPQPGDSRNRRTYSPQHFYEGIFRTERDKGTLYDLAFRENSVPDFRRLVFFRPFAPLMKVKEEFMDTSQILINIIVPLAGRVDAFRRFMHRFSEVCIGQDGRTHLTVVFFGSEKMDEVKGILDVMSRRMKYRNVTLIRLNEAFSRARGLDVGARAWKRSNVLLFFCDVNVHFTADFLNSCRMNAQPGEKVFYPVMFSQYNPEIIYGHHLPSAEDQLVIRKDFGFWKDFDFGMTCQYRSDFMNIGGFDASVKGSATEDVRLYRKFLRSSLLVVRAPSRGLFHVWHQTLCHAHLSTETFKLCLQSKALNEASHSQLGLMIFSQQINNHLLKHKQS
ncbi:chondroitin sulfate N-acetylgalactosaminyltransferase 1 [Megalobrama amblycephala]|uniref:chondroitin sulfate N-acetylgalactosaminyltransferase 1 n=1 Tax=Megalobrama amblycephala TaxID=75352 RepID=UPI0020142B7C|nr:chondroitin sulfate N-acetylgalactosaminyltransferase 1 [Megalobrama amblycephala]XP_048066733.1 chondroitin sulfate N-acetylgalactosaminyltransferase 1 [Megalobrama amblycephala]